MSRTVLVTGGGRGIGRAMALAFAAPDAHIVLAGRNRPALDAVADEVRVGGAAATVIEMDVTDVPAVERAFAEMRHGVSAIEVLVNNAGVGGGEPVQGSNIERWRRTLDVNVFGMYLVTRGCLPLMPDGSRIVNLSSVLGRFGVPGYTAYCAAKHAVIGFTRALALELAPRRITANAIVPGWVDTDMSVQGMTQGAAVLGITFEAFRRQALDAVPIGRFIEPEEVARVATFLAAPTSSAITGQAYNICGGQTMD
jgi:3-hydroxybutyrate dehydrogenase